MTHFGTGLPSLLVATWRICASTTDFIARKSCFSQRTLHRANKFAKSRELNVLNNEMNTANARRNFVRI